MDVSSASSVDFSNACLQTLVTVLTLLPSLGLHSSVWLCSQADQGIALGGRQVFLTRVSSELDLPRACLPPPVQGEAATA